MSSNDWKPPPKVAALAFSAKLIATLIAIPAGLMAGFAALVYFKDSIASPTINIEPKAKVDFRCTRDARDDTIDDCYGDDSYLKIIATLDLINETTKDIHIMELIALTKLQYEHDEPKEIALRSYQVSFYVPEEGTRKYDRKERIPFTLRGRELRALEAEYRGEPDLRVNGQRTFVLWRDFVDMLADNNGKRLVEGISMNFKIRLHGVQKLTTVACDLTLPSDFKRLRIAPNDGALEKRHTMVFSCT